MSEPMLEGPIVIGLTGGLHSAVAAVLLKKQAQAGTVIHGLYVHLKPTHLPQELQNHCRCIQNRSAEVAAKLAARIGIHFHMVDSTQQFDVDVLDGMVHSQIVGKAIQPCRSCMAGIWFPSLLGFAAQVGAKTVATGHAFQKLRDPATERWQLLVPPHCGQVRRARAELFGSLIGQNEIARLHFPNAVLEDQLLTRLATEYGLEVYCESLAAAQSLTPCWTRSNLSRHTKTGATNGEANPGSKKSAAWSPWPNVSRWMMSRIPAALRPRGMVRTEEGKLIGEHKGLQEVTLGSEHAEQGPDAPQEVQTGVVTGYDATSHTLIIGSHESAQAKNFLVTKIHWIRPMPEMFPIQVGVRVQSLALEHSLAGWLYLYENGVGQLEFDEDQISAAPGVLVYFYREDEYLGSGTIERANTEA